MSNEIIRNEFAVDVLGVPGRAFNVVRNTDTGRILAQKIGVFSRPIKGYGTNASISVELRFDESCGNGHERFAITAEVRRPGKQDVEACGCLHKDIAQVFPELAPLIKWHLVSIDGPMHYVANTCYQAGDRDCYGLRKGERKLILGPDKVPTWVSKITPEKYVKGYEQPAPVLVEYELWYREGEGKERDLGAARSCAVWPEATDEELCQERPQLEAALKARLPALLAEFKQAMLEIGFIYPEEKS